MNYIEEPFDNIFYEDDIIETKLTEKDEKNLKKMRKMINSLICSEEFKNGLYCTINDYYEDAIERGFRLVNVFHFRDNRCIQLKFKASEYKQTSLFCDKDDCEEIEYYIDLSIYYAGEDFCNINYEESIVSEHTSGLIITKSYGIDINKSNNIKCSDTFKLDKEELNDIIKRIKFNFNIK